LELSMKVQATVVLSFQAKTLTEAGAVLDDVLGRAYDRDGLDVSGVQLSTPPGDHLVTLPALEASRRSAPGVPFEGRAGNGA
jgi:hypothetical protein